MYLYGFYGKRVKIKLKSGETVEGKVNFYESALDDEEVGQESIATDACNTFWYESEIESIELLPEQ